MSFIGPAIGIGADLLGSLFGGGGGDAQEASQAAMAQERQAVERALGLLSPFQQAGVGAIGGLQGMVGQDPTSIINRILGQYQASPAEQFQKQQAQGALQNQLAAAGLSGSGAAIQQAGSLAQNLAQRGQQQFLQNVLGQRQQQMGGLEDLFRGGLSAAGTGAGLLGQEGQALGGLAGAGILGQGQEQSGLFGGLGSLAGLFGGGGSGGLFGGGGGGGLFGGMFNKPFDPNSLAPGIV
ncbi:MAG: hypothetical protein ACYSYU_05065 [Planctomycetota bacterium]|jgi:hypothetical protein